GNRIPDGGFGRWAREIRSPLNGHVYYVHSKYLLIDPLGDAPIVVTGSANFSDASTVKNDENMVVIPGDQRVAAIYLGEFIRLFVHYFFRAGVNRLRGKTRKGAEAMAFLDEPGRWAADYYELGSPREKERLLFSGQRETS